ncbi:MAG TPA: metallophosphoesterase [Pyrinomonadaceae bacterium]|nr:metallophosphoesterase [Pyrinomonadaceae bacterium]
MRTLVHLSDLHFGRTDESVVASLSRSVNELRPDLVVVSGDLTQRARRRQFREARAFLDTLPRPQIVVPGNHDVPLYNVAARFLFPLANYRRYITDDLEPFYSDEEMAVLGINTARSLTFTEGRINTRQVERVRERLCPYADETFKIVVTHHPFDLPEGHDERKLVGRAAMAMEMIARCGADLLLAGHLHVSHTGHTARRYKIRGHSALVVHAGTATSTRQRGETNAFNVVRLRHPHISVERHAWRPERAAFAPAVSETFRHTPDGWSRVPDEAAADLTFDDATRGVHPDGRPEKVR